MSQKMQRQKNNNSLSEFIVQKSLFFLSAAILYKDMAQSNTSNLLRPLQIDHFHLSKY